MKSQILRSALILSLIVPTAFAIEQNPAKKTDQQEKKDKTLLSHKVPEKGGSDAIGAAEFGAVSKKEIKDVKLSDSVKVEIGGKEVELKRVTSGLRQKKVALFWASVYVGQVFTNSKASFESIEKLRESLVAGLPVVVTMTFVRDVPIDKIVDGYKEVFEANDVNSEEEPYAQLLQAVKKSGDVKDRQTYYFTFNKTAAGKDQFSFWTNHKERLALNDVKPGVLKNLFSMWFGKAADSGLEQLQEEFLKHDSQAE